MSGRETYHAAPWAGALGHAVRSAARERLLRLQAELGDLSALLVSAPVNVAYLTGLRASSAAVLVTAESAVLATDGRYAEQACGLGHEVVVDRNDGWLAGRLPVGARLGVEAHRLPWERALELQRLLGDGVSVVPAGHRVEGLRLVKDAAEHERLAEACAITAAALTRTFEVLRPGMSERAVARTVEDALRDGGAHDRAFQTIVASGRHGARPHHRPGDRLLAAGDLVTIDAGALVDGYHADMTRTVALGAPPESLRHAYEAVRAAQAAAVGSVAAGATAGEVDDAARAVLSAAGLGDAIAHPTGHGVGLEVHEPPTLRSGVVATLPAGAVVTVEPGVYLPGVGGVRIEDTVAVTEDGCDVLTAASTELLLL